MYNNNFLYFFVGNNFQNKGFPNKVFTTTCKVVKRHFAKYRNLHKLIMNNCRVIIYNPGLFQILLFIIHPCDPTIMIFYLIWSSDIAVCITYLISHSSSLGYNTVIKEYFRFGCIINTKLPSCVVIIHRTSLGFTAGALKAYSSYGLVLPGYQL